MGDDFPVESISMQLSMAVETVMNVQANPEDRKAAYELCEDFKANSPYCVQCGLNLAKNATSVVIKYFGLQLIEHCIKFRWNDLTVDEKFYIKDNSLSLIKSGSNNLFCEDQCIKNALSKIIVEMIKREWPQRWPELRMELLELCEMGVLQTEIVMLTLLRLIEDTFTFQNIQAQRRREIQQALISKDSLFSFVLDLLYQHLSKFDELAIKPDELEPQALIHCHVATVILETLTAFVEWVPVDFIMHSNGLFLNTLCQILSNQYLKNPAIECLLQIVVRKGKLADRKPLLVLFDTKPMEGIFKAANATSTLQLEEQQYLFVKRLCQVLIGIGNQLCALWITSNKVNQPPNFSMYLDAMLEFTKHPSQVLTGCTLPLWSAFFRHEYISNDPILRSFIPHIAQTAKNKLIKVGYPSHNDSLSCSYNRIEFDCDEEFSHFFPRFRAEVADVLRLATILEPALLYNCATDWLEYQLKKPLMLGDGDLKHCSINSPPLLEWDALSVYMESVFTTIFHTNKSEPFTKDGIRLLKAVLNYDAKDPLVLSSALSCISALFPFLLQESITLPAVLDKIFSALVFSLPGQTKANRSRALKNVRLHACSSLVRICMRYPNLLLPSFERIYTHVITLSNDPEQLSQLEKCTLLEALILLSNQFKDYQKQSKFIEEILSPINSIWLSPETKQAFQSVQSFVSYIGLDQAPVEPSNDDIVGINRSQLILCINMILAIIKRSHWPKDIEDAQKGGFIKSVSELDNSPILCNPATSHVLPSLENVFFLLRCFNLLCQPEVIEKIYPAYIRACDMPETDKKNILGISSRPVDMYETVIRQPLERMQNYLTNVHDNCYHILGNAGQSLGTEFYKLPGLADCIISCILHNIDSIPDYRVRPIIRVFMKPFIHFCPPEYYQSALIPVLVQLCPYMFQRLNNKWLHLTQWFEQSNLGDEENCEAQEVLEDQLNRQLTREYIDLLAAVLHVKKTPLMDASGEVAMEEDDRHSSTYPDTLSDLGQYVLKHEVIGPTITRCCFRALSWNDSTTCNKSLALCGPVLKQLLSNHMISPEDARTLFIYVLIGLQQHGQHEMTQSYLLNLGMQTYELLRSQNICLKEVMLQIPECCKDDLQAFDDKIVQSNANKQWPEKKKKEMFKNIVGPIIGKNVGQLFKNEVHIKNITPLIQHSTPKVSSMLEDNTSESSLCRLFGDDCLDSR